MPFVGIFWYLEDNLLFTKKELPSPEIETEISIDSRYSHFDTWEEVRAKIPVLRDIEEYDSVPRGRIVFLKAEGTFRIYHGVQLHKKVLKALVDEFDLSGSPWEAMSDEHYLPF
ncbi:MAG: hypothetical protein JW969_16510 [Spirochaetales bacterium]|nr:hypothetical protein [Spirochaetales bacterium]